MIVLDNDKDLLVKYMSPIVMTRHVHCGSFDSISVRKIIGDFGNILASYLMHCRFYDKFCCLECLMVCFTILLL